MKIPPPPHDASNVDCMCAGCHGARRKRMNAPLDEKIDDVGNFLKRAAAQAVKERLDKPDVR